MNEEKDFYLNELSLCLVESKQSAYKVMENFVITTRSLRIYGFGLLRFGEGIQLQNIELTENYFIYNWKNDDEVDIEIRRRFKSLIGNTTTPIVNLTNETLKGKMRDTDVYINDQRAIGITAAHNDHSVVVSFSTNLIWERESLTASFYSIDNKEINDIEVKNISLPFHLFQHIDWIKSQVVQPDIHHGAPFPFSAISSDISGDIYTQSKGLSREEQISLYEKWAPIVAKLNFYEKNTRLPPKNEGRMIFEYGEGRDKLYLALDTQHGTFECHDHMGIGKKEWNMSGIETKKSEHDLNVK